MIVVDASYVIALRDPDDSHHQAAVSANAAMGASTALIHELTLAECLVAPARMGDLDEHSARLRTAYRVVPEAPDPAAPERWAWLRATSKLRLPDAIALDAALTHSARTLLTFDEGLGEAARASGLNTAL